MLTIVTVLPPDFTNMNRTNRPYWGALAAGASVGLLAAVSIYVCRGSLAAWQLDHNQSLLWEIVLKAVAGGVAIIGAIITAFKYIDDKAQQREQDVREGRKSFLQERQSVYRRLGLSLATIMNYDPDDNEWNPAKAQFFEIYWGELPLVADEAVLEKVKFFAIILHETKENKDGAVSKIISAPSQKHAGNLWEIRGKILKMRKKIVQ